MASTTHDAHDDHGHGGHHIPSLAILGGTYGGLLVLTVLTVVVSFLPLGALSFPVAMIVATVKASLVAGFFMHLHWDDRLNGFVCIAALLFIGLFFLFTFIDLGSRDKVTPVEGNYEYLEDRNWENYLLENPEEPAPAPGDDGAAPADGM